MLMNRTTPFMVPVDDANPAIIKNEALCSECGHCFAVCEEEIGVAAKYLLNQREAYQCIGCGQCSAVCPEKAITGRPHYKIVKELIQDPEKIVVFSTSPSVRVGFADGFGKEPGTFAQIILPEQTENFWEKYTDMDLVTNQETGAQLHLKFAKTVEDRMFYRANVHRYILNDSDFQTITAQMTEQRQMKQIFFDVEESENVYDFAIELRKEYVRRAGKDMAVLNAYNEAEEDRAEAAGEPYHYRMTEPMDPENPYLYHDWKFNPEIQPIQMKTYLHESGIMILTFLYVSCICLAAIGIIAYTRSVTIGVQNQKMFDDLRKLGAKNTYIMRCIKSQLRKIFVLPTAIGLFLILSFLMIIYIGNDKRIQSTEWMSFGCTVGFAVIICIYQLIVYRMSLKKLREILKL